MTTSPNARQLALAKLATSGLTAADLKLLGFEVLEAKAVKALDPFFKAVPGLKLPYFTADGKRLPFYRLRYLATPPSAFGEQALKPRRYVQPKDTGTAAYFPRNFKWSRILQDPTQPLFFTEGELKAACGCKHGFAVVGLGGVFNFQSVKAGVDFLPELAAIAWQGRVVYIVFDSDYHSNPQVMLALERFARKLTSLGALPRVVNLPKLSDDPNVKTGLDDFLVAEGKDEFTALVNETVDTPVARTLWEWNDRFAYIADPGGLVVDRTTGQRFSAQQFENQDFRHHRLSIPSTAADGTVRFKDVKVPTLWLDWPHRTQLASITYEPGGLPVTQGRWNLWQGWGVAPQPGNVKPWQQLLAHVFQGAPAADLTWFERWCAYPIQHPGTKLYTAVVLWGDQHGTGKSLIGYSLGRVYGKKNFAAIGQEELVAPFNDWAYGKQFILGDDVTGHDNRAYADKLKKMITQLDVRINEKFMPTFSIPDCINYLFTSNQSNAFYIEDHDRRYFLWHVDVPYLPLDFARTYDAWYRSEAGAAALHHHLATLDLGDFEPTAPARGTTAKAMAIEESKSDLGVWVLELKRSPGLTLLPDLATSRQILSEYERLTGRSTANISVNGLARELRRSQVHYFNKGVPVRTQLAQARYYVVRNHERWSKASPEEARKYLDQQHAVAVRKPTKF